MQMVLMVTPHSRDPNAFEIRRQRIPAAIAGAKSKLEPSCHCSASRW